MIMTFIKRLLGMKQPEAAAVDYSSRLIDTAKEIEPIIENTVRDLFERYHTSLLSEELTFIVYAVWGARNDGELTEEQKKINDEINPVVDNIMEKIGIEPLNAQQDYTLRYLIRSLFISKVVFLTELAQKRLCELREKDTQPIDPVLPEEFFNGFFEQDNERWKQWFGGDRGRRW